MKKLDRQCRAFTLIELVAASALAALLMVAVLALTTSAARDQRKLAAQENDSARTTDALADLLRRDLSMARHIAHDRDGDWIIDGYGSLDPATLEPTDRLVQIRWVVGQGGGSAGCLYRIQQYLDDPRDFSQSVHLVASGVKAIHLTALGQVTTAPTTGPSDANQLTGVRLQVTWDAPAPVTELREIWLR